MLMVGHGNYIKPGRDSHKNTWLVFSPKAKDDVGVLAEILDIFKVGFTHFLSSWSFGSLEVSPFLSMFIV